MAELIALLSGGIFLLILVIPFALFFIAILFVIVLAIRGQIKRSKELKAKAHELGYSYAPSSDLCPAFSTSEINELPLMRIGRFRRTGNLMVKQDGARRIAIFDYSYTVGSHDNRTTYSQTVFCLTDPAFNFPRFWMEPEGFFAKIGDALEFQDIDFSTHPKFSESYNLRGDSESLVRGLFNSQLLVTMEGNTGLHVQAAGQHLLIYDRRVMIGPQNLDAFAQSNTALAQHFIDAAAKINVPPKL